MPTEQPPEQPAELSALWPLTFAQHPLAHLVYARDTLQVLAANAAALERYGCGAEEMLGLTREDLLMPGEPVRLREFLARLPDSAQQVPQPVWRERSRSGHELFADIRGMPVRWQGRPARLAAVLDAGPRQRLQLDAGRSRDMLQVAGRMALLGGWYLDLPARTVHLSDTVCAFHELPAGTVLTLEQAVERYPDGAADAVSDAVSTCLQRGTPFDLELAFTGTLGTQRWVRTAGEVVRDEQGRIVGVQGAQQDVTARKQAEIALQESRRQSAFMSRVSHELRTPLNAIIGFGELLRREVHPGAVQAGIYLGHVLKAGRHMLALVDDLLELQRIEVGIEQGRLKSALGPVALDEVLLASTQMLEPLAASAGVVLEAAPATALVLHAELRSAQQILLNLGSNAIKYGASGGVVRISAGREGSRVAVHVSDRGAGMSPDQVQRLFQPFERLGQERRGVVGSGLGLVISRQLAQAMGGSLELASTPGQGTTVTLYLPLHEAGAAAS